MCESFMHFPFFFVYIYPSTCNLILDASDDDNDYVDDNEHDDNSSYDTDTETTEDEYDEGDVDIAYYKKKVSWVVLDEVFANDIEDTKSCKHFNTYYLFVFVYDE